MTRRALLALLVGAAVDPERAIWTPGRTLISIPKRRALWTPTGDLDLSYVSHAVLIQSIQSITGLFNPPKDFYRQYEAARKVIFGQVTAAGRGTL